MEGAISSPKKIVSLNFFEPLPQKFKNVWKELDFCSPRESVPIEAIGIHLITSPLSSKGAVTCSKKFQKSVETVSALLLQLQQNVTIPEKCENLHHNFTPATKSDKNPVLDARFFHYFF